MQKGQVLSSIEILDEGSNAWRYGPELPFPMAGTGLVEDPSGGVVLMGGRKQQYGDDLDIILRLSDTMDKWVVMPQKLERPRSEHVAIPIPDHLTNCTVN